MLNHNYLQVALFQNKIPKTIYEVATGIACDCFCPICKNPLEAKNAGKEWDKPLNTGQKIAHFAHSDGSNCAGASESILHLMAKEVLIETLSLNLPALHFKGVKLKDKMIFNFDSCVLEKRIKIDNTHIQPDAILVKGKTELYIEFYKTHLVDDSKIGKIILLNKSTIEIDLNDIPILKDGKINKDEIRNNLINQNFNRYWLHNKQQELLYEKYLANIEEEKFEAIAVEDDSDLFDDINHSTGQFYQRGIENEEGLYKWKTDLLKKGYKFLKIYKYDRFSSREAEKIYCPKKKYSEKTVDLFDCKKCEYNGKMVKYDDDEWRVVCKFSIDKFLENDKEIVNKLKGKELLNYCFEEKYPIIDKGYIQTLITIYTHIGEDMFPLLEKAEMKNKKLSIVDDRGLEINDQYFLKNIKIV